MTPGRRFADWVTPPANTLWLPRREVWPDYDAFFAYGPGAWFWRIIEAHRAFYFIPPGNHTPARIWCDHVPDNWARRGSVLGWDGNVEQPTFQPSIDHAPGTPIAWHGFIKAGNFE